MNIAILILSGASFICSAGCLCIMAKTAKDLNTVKTDVNAEIATVKAKVVHNAKVVKTALSALEL